MNHPRRRWLNSVLLLAVLIGVLGALWPAPASWEARADGAAGAAQGGEAFDLKAAAETIESAHQYVTARLADPDIWQHKKNQELIELLKLTGKLRTPKAAELLAARIDHKATVPVGFSTSMIGEAEVIPAYLIAIGTPAVEPLLDVIKSSHLIPEKAEKKGLEGWHDDEPRDRGKVIALAVRSLVGIYDHPEGMGRDLAQRVLIEERSRTDNKDERMGLEMAIKQLKPR